MSAGRIELKPEGGRSLTPDKATLGHGVVCIRCRRAYDFERWLASSTREAFCTPRTHSPQAGGAQRGPVTVTRPIACAR